MEGTILGGRYELIEKIGEGGMAIVYKARCRILDRIVAVKILRDEYSKDNNFVEKFRTEALSAARISHPNIVNMYDVGQDGEVYYIVMEYIDGKTLNEIIQEQAPLSVEKAVDIAIMICDGIHHAHEKGIIHRDIKPHNILITEHGMVKVADFGIARAVNTGTITYGNSIVGSVRYISPEQAKGEAVNRTTDIYSLGCVLYEMLTGLVPFDADSPVAVAMKHIHDDLSSPRLINEEIPTEIEEIIYKAMDKDPARRFSTALEMRNALLNLHSDIFSDYLPKRRKNDRTIIMPAVVDEGDEAEMKKRKMRPAGKALIFIAILGFLAGAVYMMGGNLFGKEIKVPDVVGLTDKQAYEKMESLGLKMTVSHEEFNEEIEEGHIVSQDPVAESNVKKGREIEVVLSKGTELITVPSLIGVDLKDIGIRLANLSLERGAVDKRYDDKYAENQVMSQDPESGDKVKEGTEINLTVSKGKQPERVNMPDLKGLTLDKARKVLENNKLVLGTINKEESTQYNSGQIVSQNTNSGVLVEEGSVINVIVSKGPGSQELVETIQFQLPEEQDFYRVVIKIKDAQGEREIYNELHRSGEKVYTGVRYFGSATATVIINSIEYETYNL